MLHMIVIQITKWDKGVTSVTVMVIRLLNIEKIIKGSKTDDYKRF